MRLTSFSKIAILSLVAVLIISCNDNLDQVGFTIQPGKDRLSVGVDTLKLQARTVRVDSVYSKTNYPVLGEYIDPVFGTIKSDYIGEFYMPSEIGFKDGAIIDSVRAIITYRTFMGDSLAPMELSVYEVNKSLKGTDDFTNIDAKEFADMTAPIGVQTFTGSNSNYTLVTTTASDYSTVTYKRYEIDVDLPIDIGHTFLAEYKKPGHGEMASTDRFRSFFPGLYFTTTFGNGTIISVDLTSLYVHYHYLDEKGSSTGQDTIRTDAFRLNVTPEVRQVNSISNKNDDLLIDNSTHTYIKSPAGVNTEITFPVSEIHDRLKEQALNLVDFTVYALPEANENELVKLNPPNYLLLINKDSLDGFFENSKLRDNVTSFLSEAFDSSTYSYKFNNISTMLNYYNEKFEGEPYDLVYYLIPVDATFTTYQQSYYSASQQILTAIHNQMWPTATVLDKREGNLQLEMIFSNF